MIGFYRFFEKGNVIVGVGTIGCIVDVARVCAKFSTNWSGAKTISPPQLLAVFRDLVAKSRAEAGNLRYDLHQDLQNENRFVFVETWQDQAAVDSHNASGHFQGFVQAIDGKTDSVEIVLMTDVSENGN